MTPPVKPDAGGAPPNPPNPPPAEGAGDGAFDRNKLNPVIRDMSPEQINDLLETMSVGLKAKREAAEAPPAPPAPPREPDKPPVDLREALNPQSEKYDPETALDYIIRKNYGGVVRDLSDRTVQSAYVALRQEYPDFKDFEPDIRKAFKDDDPTTVTPQRILGAYFQAKGIRQTLDERKKRAAAAGDGTLPPSPPAPPKKEEELSPIELEVARKMFRRAADPVAEYKKHLQSIEAPMEMKVPVGAGKME